MLGGRAVPAWLNEGLATVLEPAGSLEAELALLSTDKRPALPHLHAGFINLSTRDAELAYASSARATRRLIEQRGLATLVLLLEDLGRGVPFDRAFQQRIGLRYEDFAASLARD